jgi:CubicO group peptidase (beta-lactamase class C family)
MRGQPAKPVLMDWGRFFIALWATVLGFALAASPARAQSAFAGAAAELDAARAALQIPALGVAVVVNGRVVMAEGLGVRGFDDPTPINADTRFAIGSCSKAFTAFGVALLAEQGLLSLDDLVRTHDSSLALPMAGALERLRVVDLLSQRSGLARHDFLWHALPAMTRERFAMIQADLPMQALPGARYGYTNSAYILAGRLIELKTGLSWEDFTTQRIFTPLGMARSNFSSAGLAEDANAAIATKRREGQNRTVPWRDGRLLGPAGSINSSPRDMAQWLLALTQGGMVDGQQVISPSTLNTLWTPVAPQPPRRGRQAESPEGYALGWRIDTWRGLRRVMHTGAVDGFRARVTLFPDQGVGFVVMANLAPTMIHEWASRVLAERALGLPRSTDIVGLANRAVALEAQALAEGPTAVVPRGRVARLGERDPTFAPNAPLSDFEGVYAHPAYGEIRIEPGAEGAPLRVRFGALQGRLELWRANGFVAYSDFPDDTLDEGEFVFLQAEDGAVTGFTAYLDNDIAPIAFIRDGPLPVLEDAAEGVLMEAELVGPLAGELGPWGRAALALLGLLLVGGLWAARSRRW